MSYLDICRAMSADIHTARTYVAEALRYADQDQADFYRREGECIRRRQSALVAAVRAALEQYDLERLAQAQGEWPLDPALFGQPLPFTARRALESLARLETAEEDFRVLSMAWADSIGFGADAAPQIALRAPGPELPVNRPPKGRGE